MKLEVATPEKIPVTVNGKEYQFQRLNLRQLSTLIEVDNKLAEIVVQAVITDKAKFDEADQIWLAWCTQTFAGEYPPLSEITFAEAREIRDLFFDLMFGRRKPDGTVVNLPVSKAPQR